MEPNHGLNPVRSQKQTSRAHANHVHGGDKFDKLNQGTNSTWCSPATPTRSPTVPLATRSRGTTASRVQPQPLHRCWHLHVHLGEPVATLHTDWDVPCTHLKLLLSDFTRQLYNFFERRACGLHLAHSRNTQFWQNNFVYFWRHNRFCANAPIVACCHAQHKVLEVTTWKKKEVVGATWVPEMWPDFGHLQEQFLSGLPLREMHLRRHGCRFHFLVRCSILYWCFLGRQNFGTSCSSWPFWLSRCWPLLPESNSGVSLL